MRFGSTKKFLAAAVLSLVGLGATQARAGSITFASFQDAAANQWHYNNAAGTLTASTTASFISFNNILNNAATGVWTETLNATVAGAATNVAGTLKQGISGTLTFKSGATTVLSAQFVGAVLSGTAGSQSSNLGADNSVVVGQITSFTSSPGFQIPGTAFVNPYSFSISLTQNLALNIASVGVTSNFNSFDATAQGSFSADSTGAIPTPLPASVWGGLSLMAAAGAFGAVRRRRQMA